MGARSGRYSSQNVVQSSSGVISVPVVSVMFWTVLDSSIWRRRGSSRPCSAAMM